MCRVTQGKLKHRRNYAQHWLFGNSLKHKESIIASAPEAANG